MYACGTVKCMHARRNPPAIRTQHEVDVRRRLEIDELVSHEILQADPLDAADASAGRTAKRAKEQNLLYSRQL